MTPRTVVVTGVARDFAARVARSLAAETEPGGADPAPRYRVIGVDTTPPRRDLGSAEFARADIRSPMLAKLLAAQQVQAVVHLATVDAGRSSTPMNRSVSKDYNVLGTMQLVATCSRTPSIEQVVMLSSTAVYGSSPRDPVRFTEELTARASQSAFGRDCVEAEAYLTHLAQRRDDVVVTVLRLANLVGAGMSTALTDYLAMPVVPRIAGFDARLQFLHPSDAIAALTIVLQRRLAGTYNIAAPDVLTLAQLVRWLGRPSVPVARPVAPALLRLANRSGLIRLPEELDSITFGRGVDSTRFTEATGFRPRYSSREAVAEFVAMADEGLLSLERLDRFGDQLARLMAPAVLSRPGRRER